MTSGTALFDYKSGLEGYRHLWDTHKELPDAIICINDNVAVAVCEAAAQMGFTAPKDFRITGFDNFDKAGFYTPSITTVGHIRGSCIQGNGYSPENLGGRNVPSTISPILRCCGRRAVAAAKEAAGMPEPI